MRQITSEWVAKAEGGARPSSRVVGNAVRIYEGANQIQREEIGKGLISAAASGE